MGDKLFLAIVITLLLAILSEVNGLQPTTSAVLAEKSSAKQKLSFQILRPAPSHSETMQ